MLYNLPDSVNPLFGPRSFGRPLTRNRSRGLRGLSGAPDEIASQTATPSNVLAYQYPTGVWVNEGAGTGAQWSFLTNADFSTYVGYGSARYLKLKAALKPAPSSSPAPIQYPAQVPGWRVVTDSNYLERDTRPFPWANNQPDPGGTYPAGTSFVNSVPLNSALFPRYVYIYKDENLGTVDMPNGRRYILYRITIRNQDTGQDMIYYATVEGGGSGNVWDAIAPTVARVVTDVGTFGQSEIIRAADSDIGSKVETAYTAGVVGGAAAILTGGVLAPGAAGALFASGVVAGEGSAIPAEILGTPETSDVLSQAAGAGAAAGVVSSLFIGPPPPGMGPVTLTPDTAGATAFSPGSPLSLVSSTPPPPVFGLPPVLAPVADFSAPPIDHLPLPVRPQDTAGSTVLPPELSITSAPTYGVPPPTPIPYSPPVYTGYPSGYPSTFTPPSNSFIAPSPIDSAGSTLLPPELSLTPPDLGLLPAPGGSTSFLTDILNAGKVAVPGAVSGYQIYKKITTPETAPSGDGGSGTYVFGSDPYAAKGTKTPAAKPSYAAPILAGVAALVLFGMKAKHHA